MCFLAHTPPEKKMAESGPSQSGTLRRVVGKCLLHSREVKMEMACLGMGLQRFVQ